MPKKKTDQIKEKARQLYVTMRKVNLAEIASALGIEKAAIKEWRDEGGWPQQRARFRSERRKQELCLALKDRAEQVLHSCDVVLRLLSRDMRQFAREVQPDQEQMVRLTRIIRDINTMADNAMKDLQALDEADKESEE
jgi:uncharacterized protein YjcR